MAVAVYTSDLTAIVPADTTNISNWRALGGGKSGLNIETDYFIQGSSCVSKDAFASSTKGMIESGTGTSLTSGDLAAVYMWITHLTPGSLDTKANGGMRVIMGSSSSTYNEYYYAGKDTIDYGAPWICAVVDPENATASTGTVLHTAMSAYGSITKLVGGPTKGSPLGIDAIRQGRSYDITAGASATPATFAGAAAKNDLQANRYGQFQGVPGVSGAYTMQCRLGIGTVTTAAYFEDSNFTISLNDLEFVNPGFQEFEVVNAGTTCIWKNGTISAVGTNSKGNFKATSSLLIDHTGMTFNDMGTFLYDANSTASSAKYVRCGQVTGGSFNKTTFDSSPAAISLSIAALSKAISCIFISDGSNHAIELTSIGSGAMAINLDLTNYDTGSTGSPVTPTNTGNEAIFVNVASGTLTINSSGSIPSIRSAGAIVNVIAGQRTIKFTGLPDGIEVRYRMGTSTIQHTQNTSGGEVSYSYTFASILPIRVSFTGAGIIQSVTNTYYLKDEDQTIPMSFDVPISYI